MAGHRRAEATPSFGRLWPGHDEPANLRPLIHSALVFRRSKGPGTHISPVLLGFPKEDGGRGGFAIDIAKASRPCVSVAKVILGFAVVPCSSRRPAWASPIWDSERVSMPASPATATASPKPDLARNIDRELDFCTGELARYYVVTGKEDDATAGAGRRGPPQGRHPSGR